MIEEHAAWEEARPAHVRPRSNPAHLKLGCAIASEVLAITAAVFEHAETISPFFAVPAEGLALVDEASAVDAWDPKLVHGCDVDPRERAE